MYEKVISLIQEKKYKEIRDFLNELNGPDVTEILNELPERELLITFRLLQKDLAVDVFARLAPNKQEEIISKTSDKEMKEIINNLFFDDMVDLVEEMPANVVKKILSNVNPKDRQMVNQFLRYPKDSAGSIMTIEYVDLKRTYNVKRALLDIKQTGLEKETIYTNYVINESRKLEGIVSLKDLVISDDDETIENIMSTDVIYVYTDEDQETVANLFKKYDFLALPVVDREERLVGIITVDDIIDVIDEETTEDFYKMAAISPTTDEYLATKPTQLAKHRLTWLLVLMISATFTGFIIRHYENALSTTVVLAAFIPMLMDTSGNAGSQTSTIIIRSLALGEVKVKDAFKVMFKEFEVSIIVGVILSAVNFVRVLLIERLSIQIAAVVSITLLITIIMAKLIGSILPIIASKLKLDPATMSGPIITTIVDALSLLIYFQLATMILGV